MSENRGIAGSGETFLALPVNPSTASLRLFTAEFMVESMSVCVPGSALLSALGDGC